MSEGRSVVTNTTWKLKFLFSVLCFTLLFAFRGLSEFVFFLCAPSFYFLSFPPFSLLLPSQTLDFDPAVCVMTLLAWVLSDLKLQMVGICHIRLWSPKQFAPWQVQLSTFHWSLTLTLPFLLLSLSLSSVVSLTLQLSAHFQGASFNHDEASWVTDCALNPSLFITVDIWVSKKGLQLTATVTIS